MKLVMVTDIHLAGPGETVRGRDPRANLEAAFGEIAAIHADAELAVLAGDLCEDPSVEAYRWLRARAAALPMPVAPMIGNHDDRGQMLSVFPEAADEHGRVQGAYRVSQGTVLCLDTVIDGALGGTLDDARLDWLEARLGAGQGPFWIFLHHNPIPTHLAPLDRIMLERSERFEALLARHRDAIAHIFHGHTHLPMSGSLMGIPVSSGRGTNHAGYPNYGSDALLPLSDLPESYSVIIAADGAVTVMMVEFGYRLRNRGES